MMIAFVSLLSPSLALLFIIVLCIKNWKKDVKGSLKSFVFPFGMIFGTFGYSIQLTSKTSDLQSYLSQIEAMRPYTFGEVMARNTDGLYLQDGLFYFVSRCGNEHVLPFIVGFIIYSIVFYVLFDMIGRSKRTYRVWEVALLALIMIGVLSSYTIIGNTRCVLSFVLITFAVYRDMIQKKKNIWTLLLYILPVWLHSAAIVIIFIRLLAILFQKFEKVKWIILCAVLLFPTIIDFLYTYVAGAFSGLVGSVVSGAINKAYYYLHWTSGGWATQIESSLHSNLIKIFGTIFLIMIIILIFKKIPNDGAKKRKSLYGEPMIGFLFLIAVLALGCLYIKTGASWRFEAIVVLFSPVILVQAIDNHVLNRKYFYLMSAYVAMLFVMNFRYQTSNELVLDYITTPGLEIICELLKGVLNLTG